MLEKSLFTLDYLEQSPDYYPLLRDDSYILYSFNNRKTNAGRYQLHSIKTGINFSLSFEFDFLKEDFQDRNSSLYNSSTIWINSPCCNVLLNAHLHNSKCSLCGSYYDISSQGDYLFEDGVEFAGEWVEKLSNADCFESLIFADDFKEYLRKLHLDINRKVWTELEETIVIDAGVSALELLASITSKPEFIKKRLAFRLPENKIFALKPVNHNEVFLYPMIFNTND